MQHVNPNDFSVMINPQSKNAAAVAGWMTEHIANRTDPASLAPGMPPLYGQDAVPHTMTFQSLIGSFSRAYINPDEAMRDSVQNAHLMEKDVGLLESVECRQRLTALLDWEIKPENEKCQYQVSLAQELQRIIGRIKHFTKYRMWLMKAIWSGRSGIQHRYGYTRVNGAMRMMPSPLHRDHNGWMPVNGDKLVFRYEDSIQSERDSGAYPHQMGIRVGTNMGHNQPRIHREYELEPCSDGLALFLKPYERDTFCVHKHFVEDADFHHSFFSGSIHGIGIRSKIYWEWFLKQEAFAFLMQYLERSAGGIEVWTYPMGDPKALAATQAAAREKMANGRNVIFFPKPLGDDSDSYKFEIIEPGAMGLDIMQNIIENYFGGRLKRYILGQELSTEAKATGMGSGVAEAHMDTLAQIVQFDANNLQETLTHELVRYIQQLNFPETLGWHMRLELKTQDDKTQERMDALNSAYQMGAGIAESEVFRTLGLSSPAAGEKILSMASQQAAMAPPGMPGMDPMAGGMPPEAGDEENPEDGDFPDEETSGNQESDDDSQNPMELIRSMMNQYVADMDRDQYMTQLGFKFEEKLHPRESTMFGNKKPGEFASKDHGIFGQSKPKQQTLFGLPMQTPKPKLTGGQQQKKATRPHIANAIRSLFAEHVARHEESQHNNAVSEKTAPPVAKATPEHEPTPEPTPVAPRRRMAGQGTDAKAVAAPPLPPVAQQKQADPPSVETVPHPSPKADAAVQTPATSEQVESEKQGGFSDMSKSKQDSDTSGQRVDSGDTTPEKKTYRQVVPKVEAKELSERDKLISDHFYMVPRVVRMMMAKGWSTRDEDAATSAATEGLMKAAEAFDGSSDFKTFAKNGMAQEIKNLNRRKMDKLTQSGSRQEDSSDPMEAAGGYRDEDTVEKSDSFQELKDALADLPEHERWLFTHWTLGADHNGNERTQHEIREAYNDMFSKEHDGKQLSTPTLASHHARILDKLKKHLRDDTMHYAIVRKHVIRYFRRQLLDMQVERYERRLDRTIREAAEYTETDPTDAQIKAGNYKKGRFAWNGMQIVIENPRGSVRRGVSEDGEIWRNTMQGHYGYISGTNGVDGDQVDIFMGRHPESDIVFVVKQIAQNTGLFDEHKCVLGCVNEKQAKALYLAHYPAKWKCGEITPMTVCDFKKWIDGDCCT